jgi:hypothetical protein
MKKIFLMAMLTLGISTFENKAFGQDSWYQGRKAGIYSVGIGGAQAIGVGTYSGYTASAIVPPGMSINVAGEYKVWNYIGVGWQSGVLFGFYPRYYYGGGGLLAVGIPFIAKANVHILDAANADIADGKLDVYGGIEFGGGPSFIKGGGVGGFIQVGPQVGVRYWFTSKVAVFGEFGWGATFANAGVTF